MYVCICNALTDRRLKDAIATGQSRSPGQVYAACGCRAKCGTCVKIVKNLLQEHCPTLDPAPACAD